MGDNDTAPKWVRRGETLHGVALEATQDSHDQDVVAQLLRGVWYSELGLPKPCFVFEQ
jgi:hypothetical protein